MLETRSSILTLLIFDPTLDLYFCCVESSPVAIATLPGT
jgi:hypothetical protein